MFKSTPTDSHTKGTGTTNSYPPHPSRQFLFHGKEKKKKKAYLKNTIGKMEKTTEKEEEEKEKEERKPTKAISRAPRC